MVCVGCEVTNTAAFLSSSNPSIVELPLFYSLTVQTLDKNENVIEAASGSNLLDLTLLINLLVRTTS